MERNLCNHFHSYSASPLQPIASGGQHSECTAAYFSWPTSTLLHGAAEGRANYFGNLQKGVLPAHLGRLPTGQQATTLLDLMTIRAFHSKILRRYSLVKGLSEIGNVKVIDLQSPINSLIGRQVVKVGRSSGLTTGTVMAYALEYNDEKGICFFTDFLVVGENQQTFDLEGDSGSLIILSGQDGEKPQPIGIIWGGTANRGRLKLKSGQGPENWTSGVDLGRLLDLLELDLITTREGLQGEYSCTTPCWSRGTEEARLAEGWLSVQGRKVTLLFQGKKG
ncbi:hypothetical protein GW17_00009777 [Ensete ventricosum]|nr:hypothetical protein GW17_00009777 [Ensete ventricosum]